MEAHQESAFVRALFACKKREELGWPAAVASGRTCVGQDPPVCGPNKTLAQASSPDPAGRFCADTNDVISVCVCVFARPCKAHRSPVTCGRRARAGGLGADLYSNSAPANQLSDGPAGRTDESLEEEKLSLWSAVREVGKNGQLWWPRVDYFSPALSASPSGGRELVSALAGQTGGSAQTSSSRLARTARGGRKR